MDDGGFLISLKVLLMPCKFFGSTGSPYFQPIRIHTQTRLHCDWPNVWKGSAAVQCSRKTYMAWAVEAFILFDFLEGKSFGVGHFFFLNHDDEVSF